jgi:flagellar P-ring protein precursor FlgI
MADAINTMKLFKEHLIDEPASPIDAATIRIELPEKLRDQAKNPSRPDKRNGQPQLVRIIHKIENMIVEPDQTARIVVNERTGTIVVGEYVRISTVAISHGALSVSVTENQQVSQPGPFAEAGETETVDRTAVDVQEGGGQTNLLQGGITVSELAKALNSLGTTSRDIIAILQAIKKAGALQADLIIM